MSASSVLTVVGRQTKPSVIDDDHLGRMTLGDRALEREILEIFVRQMTVMLTRIAGAEPPIVAAAAHTLLGSSRGIGARRVASAAERLELAAGRNDSETDIDEAIEELKAAAIEASAAICARLDASLAGVSRAVERSQA
jgi:HPt (histidine-containing phosphotransfer) domain-containing protein